MEEWLAISGGAPRGLRGRRRLAPLRLGRSGRSRPSAPSSSCTASAPTRRTGPARRASSSAPAAPSSFRTGPAPGAASRRAAPPATGIPGRVAALDALFRALALDKADLVGHSLGGWTVAAFALRHPEKTGRLVLVDAGGFDAARRRRGRAPPRPPEDRPGARRVLDLLFFRRPFPAAGFVVNAFGRNYGGDPAAATVKSLELRRRARRAARRICPAGTAVIWGAEETLFPLPLGKKLAAEIPGGRLFVLPGAGHDGPLETPRAFREALLARADVRRRSVRRQPVDRERGPPPRIAASRDHRSPPAREARRLERAAVRVEDVPAECDARVREVPECDDGPAPRPGRREELLHDVRVPRGAARRRGRRARAGLRARRRRARPRARAPGRRTRPTSAETRPTARTRRRPTPPRRRRRPPSTTAARRRRSGPNRLEHDRGPETGENENVRRHRRDPIRICAGVFRGEKAAREEEPRREEQRARRTPARGAPRRAREREARDRGRDDGPGRVAVALVHVPAPEEERARSPSRSAREGGPRPRPRAGAARAPARGRRGVRGAGRSARRAARRRRAPRRARARARRASVRPSRCAARGREDRDARARRRARPGRGGRRRSRRPRAPRTRRRERASAAERRPRRAQARPRRERGEAPTSRRRPIPIAPS